MIEQPFEFREGSSYGNTKTKLSVFKNNKGVRYFFDGTEFQPDRVKYVQVADSDNSILELEAKVEKGYVLLSPIDKNYTAVDLLKFYYSTYIIECYDDKNGGSWMLNVPITLGPDDLQNCRAVLGLIMKEEVDG